MPGVDLSTPLLPPVPVSADGAAAPAAPSHQPLSTGESLSQLLLRSQGGAWRGESENRAPALIYHIKMSAGLASPAWPA